MTSKDRKAHERLEHYISIVLYNIDLYGVKEAKKTLYALTDETERAKNIIWEKTMKRYL